jgi:hypothetical protein
MKRMADNLLSVQARSLVERVAHLDQPEIEEDEYEDRQNRARHKNEVTAQLLRAGHIEHAGSGFAITESGLRRLELLNRKITIVR